VPAAVDHLPHHPWLPSTASSPQRHRVLMHQRADRGQAAVGAWRWPGVSAAGAWAALGADTRASISRHGKPCRCSRHCSSSWIRPYCWSITCCMASTCWLSSSTRWSSRVASSSPGVREVDDHGVPPRPSGDSTGWTSCRHGARRTQEHQHDARRHMAARIVLRVIHSRESHGVFPSRAMIPNGRRVCECGSFSAAAAERGGDHGALEFQHGSVRPSVGRAAPPARRSGSPRRRAASSSSSKTSTLVGRGPAAQRQCGRARASRTRPGTPRPCDDRRRAVVPEVGRHRAGLVPGLSAPARPPERLRQSSLKARTRRTRRPTRRARPTAGGRPRALPQGDISTSMDGGAGDPRGRLHRSRASCP